MNTNEIPYLKPGDTIALAAPARAVSANEMLPAITMMRSWGLDVLVPEGLYEREGQLAGTDAHRAALMQSLLDDSAVKAIICCRGGYGTVRIIDRLDFSRFAKTPKWIIGYSDITVLHSHIHRTLGLPTIHATMPINFPADMQPNAATESLRRILFGERLNIEWQTGEQEVACSPQQDLDIGNTSIVGGNLSILYSLLGSKSQIDTRGKVLLIEDLDEYLYHIDRMMNALKRAGMLDGLAALMVGGMNDMHDNSTPWGKTASETILDVTSDCGYPIIFGAPFGHTPCSNIAVPLGMPVKIVTADLKKISIFAP